MVISILIGRSFDSFFPLYTHLIDNDNCASIYVCAVDVDVVVAVAVAVAVSGAGAGATTT